MGKGMQDYRGGKPYGLMSVTDCPNLTFHFLLLAMGPYYLNKNNWLKQEPVMR